MIILNTLTSAVSTYTLSPQSITPTHMGDASGLYAFGGDLDDDQPIVAEIVTGMTNWDSSLKKHLDLVYFSLTGSDGDLIVRGKKADYTYPFVVRESGQSRAKPGMGIRENYLAFGYRNPAGGDFQLDRIEVSVAQSKARRVS
jgi:hypothetical protein